MTNASAMLAALGDPTRQAILDALSDGPLAVGQLAATLPVSRPAVSQHLRVLKDAGLVRDRQEGTRRVYRVDPDGLALLRAHLDGFWERSLAAFADHTHKESDMIGSSDRTTATDAVRQEVVVDVAPARAFAIFTVEMTSWWPGDHHIGSAPIAEIVVEPRVGGRWFTRHEDGTETSTGVVTVWEPPTRLVLTWQIGADWQFHDNLVTTVTVTFDDAGAGRTRVVLEHGGLDAFGADAARMREMFSGPDAWDATLASYAAVTGT